MARTKLLDAHDLGLVLPFRQGHGILPTQIRRCLGHLSLRLGRADTLSMAMHWLSTARRSSPCGPSRSHLRSRIDMCCHMFLSGRFLRRSKGPGTLPGHLARRTLPALVSACEEALGPKFGLDTVSRSALSPPRVVGQHKVHNLFILSICRVSRYATRKRTS